jgi:hypothetical protein
MDVNESWDYQAAAGVDRCPGRWGKRAFLDDRNPPADHADIEIIICLRGGIDDAPAGDDQIELFGRQGRSK